MAIRPVVYLVFGVAATLFFAAVAPVLSFDVTPFNIQNQSPVVQIYGLPVFHDADLVPAGKLEAGLTVHVSNSFAVNTDGGEEISLDGETCRFSAGFRDGVTERLEGGVEIPYLIQGGGFLDGFLENYHEFWGLPSGGRDTAPRDRLLYSYRRNGAERLRVDGSSEGIGDLRLTGAYRLFRESDESGTKALALRAELKLPTGDSDPLHGSGSTDLALYLAARAGGTTRFGSFALFGTLGAVAMTDGDVLEEQQKNLAAFGSVGAGWGPLSWLALKVQLDAHTPFYGDTGLRELGANAAQLTLGGSLRFSENTLLDLAVSEDIVVRTSPDAVFHISLRHLF